MAQSNEQGGDELRFKGIQYDKKRDRYNGVIMHNGVTYKSKYTKDPDVAQQWYRDKAEELGILTAKVNPKLPEMEDTHGTK